MVKLVSYFVRDKNQGCEFEFRLHRFRSRSRSNQIQIRHARNKNIRIWTTKITDPIPEKTGYKSDLEEETVPAPDPASKENPDLTKMLGSAILLKQELRVWHLPINIFYENRVEAER